MDSSKQAKSLLESLLGYPLSKQERLRNQYIESGRSESDCACENGSFVSHTDDVEFAYRLFSYNSHDIYLAIDPAVSIHSVKLVRNGITYRTLDPSFYRPHLKQGFVKYIEQCQTWCGCKPSCDCVQLAVDADWLFDECLPTDLQLVLDAFTRYFSAGAAANIKKQTLGTHSYELADTSKPWEMTHNKSILKKWAGPNGSLYYMPV